MRSALGLGLLLALWGCSGGGSGGGKMAIQSCSLGCSSSGTQTQFSCSSTDIFVNQEIRVAFSSPVDLASVNNNTFRVKEDLTGKTPPGTFDLDPSDPRIVIYRPLLTFDSSGAPSFGLKEDATYRITIPGTATDPNEQSYVRNTSGTPNSTRLFCVVTASKGVFDVKPGKPQAQSFVDIVGGSGIVQAQNPETDFDNQAPVVSRSTDITIRFNDIMNPATVVNPVTKESNSITVKVDTDGDISDSSDQVTLPGEFNIAIDQNNLTTTVIFRPDGDLPSSGSDPNVKRKVVVDLPLSIRDLGGNSLVQPRKIVFTAEQIVFPPMTITEGFDGSVREDSARSGVGWADQSRLTPGVGGGSGRLGELIIRSGTTVTLSTDTSGEDFSGISDLATFNPSNVIDPTTFGQVDPITDGIFEFSRLRIDAGGTLRFRGEQPARVYVRGESVVQGILDVSGASASNHDSDDECGGVGGGAGPSGGAGGDGGIRPDGTGFEAEGGDPNEVKTPVMLYEDVDGKDGGGIPAPDALVMNPTLVAGGGGGLAWPQPDPSLPMGHFPADITDTSGMQFEQRFNCQNRIPGAAAGGGGHAFSGKDGQTKLVPLVSALDPATPPPVAVGGDNSMLAIDPTVQMLDPEAGHLRGGGGGGGGGSHLQGTAVNGLILDDCTVPATGMTLVIQSFLHHSSAGGGGGGGGLQVQAGRRVQVDGVVDASGGTGGGTQTGKMAQAGGGGAGGSVLLQGPLLQIQAVAGRVDVRGGTGGLGINSSLGGDASPGLVRLETLPSNPLVFATEAPKVAPTDAAIQAAFPGDVTDVLSIGEWDPPAVGGPLPTFGRDNFAGAQSCWIKPPGNFFELQFSEDGGPFALPEGLGWDMLLRIEGLNDPQSFRGDNDLFGSTSIEDMFGKVLGGSPLVIRFQGARALGDLNDPCNVALANAAQAGIQSEIFAGSLTGWVDHPSELNDFFGNDPVLRPNMFRFAVIWDASQTDYDIIEGIEEIEIPVLPD